MTDSPFAQAAIQLILLALISSADPGLLSRHCRPNLPDRLAGGGSDHDTADRNYRDAGACRRDGEFRRYGDRAGRLRIHRHHQHRPLYFRRQSFLMLLELLGVAALLFGLFFCAVGVLGVIRMPDSLTRLHASGKVATLGLFGSCWLGAALLMPSIWLRLLALGLFVLLTSPVATHAIAASVYRRREIVESRARAKAPASPRRFRWLLHRRGGRNSGAFSLAHPRHHRGAGTRAPPSYARRQDETRQMTVTRSEAAGLFE